jgi:glutathione S-transferase
MPQYKLTYFNIRGKGELIRLLFTVAGVEFEDNRIEHSDWPGNYRETLNVPFLQLPILAIDGVSYCQSVSISRYLADKFCLSGKTELEKLRADMIVHCIDDFWGAIVRIFREKDETNKANLLKKFNEEDVPTFYGNFEKLLKQNGGGDGFYVGDSLTWADLAMYEYLTSFPRAIGVDPTPIISSYPKLKALAERVEKVPKIAEYIAKRPVSNF